VSPYRSLAVLISAMLALPALASNCEVIRRMDAYAGTKVVPQDTTCTTFLTETGKTGASCYWVFGFRDPKARAFAADLSGTLRACRDGASLKEDQRVNHPDSYDLQSLRTSEGIYSISIKDKGALNQTFVFLRLDPN